MLKPVYESASFQMLRYLHARKRGKTKIKQGIVPLNVIPKGVYCYDKDHVCPFWSKNKSQPDGNNGYCELMEFGDWMLGQGLLWDRVKECCINMEETHE